LKTRFITMAGCAAMALGLCLASPVRAQHLTDGSFSNPAEWDPLRPTVTKHFFAGAPDGSGNAYLYVEHQLGAKNLLYLMYDYVGSPPGSDATNSFFDVFFEVNGGPDPNDYIVHFDSGSFSAFERPHGDIPPFNPDGSFDISPGSGWDPLSPADLALARFSTSIGFGASPDQAANHLMAEFELSVGDATNGGNGIYSPEPAFWSASKGGANVGDPPISSAIFQLNPDGTTFVLPQLGPNGGPIQIPSQAVPEAGAVAMLGCAGLSLAVFAYRRKRR
jgi:hypothetical protein